MILPTLFFFPFHLWVSSHNSSEEMNYTSLDFHTHTVHISTLQFYSIISLDTSSQSIIIIVCISRSTHVMFLGRLEYFLVVHLNFPPENVRFPRRQTSEGSSSHIHLTLVTRIRSSVVGLKSGENPCKRFRPMAERKWAHKIRSLQEPPTRIIPCLNV